MDSHEQTREVLSLALRISKLPPRVALSAFFIGGCDWLNMGITPLDIVLGILLEMRSVYDVSEGDTDEVRKQNNKHQERLILLYDAIERIGKELDSGE